MMKDLSGCPEKLGHGGGEELVQLRLINVPGQSLRERKVGTRSKTLLGLQVTSSGLWTRNDSIALVMEHEEFQSGIFPFAIHRGVFGGWLCAGFWANLNRTGAQPSNCQVSQRFLGALALGMRYTCRGAETAAAVRFLPTHCSLLAHLRFRD